MAKKLIERMKLEHLDSIIKLGLSTPELQTGTDVPQFYYKETLSRWISSKYGILLTASVDNNIVGFSITAYNPDSRDGYMHCIVVDEKYRKHGLGTKMLEHTLSELERLGCNHVYGLVKTSNKKTKRFFEKQNFEVGEAFNYVQRTLPRFE